MQLKDIFQPIEKELKEVSGALASSLSKSKNESILKIGRFLLETPGKRLRPALVILSAKATSTYHSPITGNQLTQIASAMELIHAASLIHDDVIDHASLRHNKSTINYKWGNDVSIALGDYLYSVAFELISICGNTGILQCISSATKSMCEGELIQVCERDDLALLRERYITIVKKKTASLFIASCRAGAILADAKLSYKDAVSEYGLNFGIAFQIMDDYLDLIARQEDLGKSPGADFKMGELTLPILNLLSQSEDKAKIISLLKEKDKQKTFGRIRQRFMNSPALFKTKEDISFYVEKAKRGLNRLEESSFKQSLSGLADFVIEKINIQQ